MLFLSFYQRLQHKSSSVSPGGEGQQQSWNGSVLSSGIFCDPLVQRATRKQRHHCPLTTSLPRGAICASGSTPDQLIWRVHSGEQESRSRFKVLILSIQENHKPLSLYVHFPFILIYRCTLSIILHLNQCICITQKVPIKSKCGYNFFINCIKPAPFWDDTWFQCLVSPLPHTFQIS